MAIRIQMAAGLALAAAGIAALSGAWPWLAHFSYPVIWWGVLLLLDAWNVRLWGAAPMHSHGCQFLGITLPLSVLYWLVYEFLNLRFPQWRYEGEPESAAVQMLFGFAAYATVIPIMVELQWGIAGPGARWILPSAIDRHLQRRRALCAAAGAALLALPAFVPWFWVNQCMWIAPALIAAPLLTSEAKDRVRPAAFAVSVAAAGIAGGLLWELFNYWSPTKWKYLVLPQAPHLFEMPLAGYLGFIPFAFSTVALYRWQQRLRPCPALTVALYALTAAALYLFVSGHAETATAYRLHAL